MAETGQTLAQRLKQRYRGVYDDIPDAELEQKVLQKYPGVYDDLPRTATGQPAAVAALAAPRSFLDIGASQQAQGQALASDVVNRAANTTADTSGENILRQIGLTGRAAITGGTALAQIPANAINGLINLGIEHYNQATGQSIPKLNSASGALENVLTSAGLPESKDTTERLVYDINRALSGTATTLGAGGASAPTTAVGQGVKSAITAAPASQVASAVTGATAAGATRELGGGPVAQMAAGTAGAFLPAIPQTARVAAQATRELYRGGEAGRRNMLENIQAFEDAGTTPSVGQATEGRIPRASESLLAKTPGSAGRMAAAGEAQQAQIGEKVQELSTTLSPRADKITAGRGIEQGVAGEGGFYDQFRATQKTLYDKLDKFIPPDKEVPAAATQATLTKLSKTDPRVQDVVRALSGTKLENITEAFSGALQGEGPTTARIGGQKFELPTSMAEKLGIKSETGTLPFSALKDLRSRVGYLLENKDQIADIPTSQLKQIYGSMSRDMEMAAKQADAESFAKGAPTGAADAYGRANKYTAAGMDRVAMLKSVINRADSEGIVDAAMSNSREGATKIRAITRSIPSEARDTLAAYVVQKMGRALPGQQGAEGETFSSNTFLTNWNKLSPEAKIQLFVNDDVRRGLDNVAKVAQNIREGSKVFANPSGTQPAIALSSGVGGAVLGVLTGHPGAAGALVGGMGLANLSARLYTNPRFVAWLSRNTATPTGQLAAQLNNLARSATTPEEKRDFAALQQEIQNRQQEQPKND